MDKSQKRLGKLSTCSHDYCCSNKDIPRINEADTKSSPTDNESEAVVLGKVPSNEEGGEVTLDELQ